MRRSILGLLGAIGLVCTNAGCQLVIPGTTTTTQTDVPSAQTTIKGGRVEDSKSETAKLCFATAKELEESGNFDEAIVRYERAIAFDARYTEAATRRLAVLYDRQGHFDRARTEYEKLLTKNPKDADTLNNLGYGYYCRELWDLSEQYLRKATAANPEHKAAWVNLGMTLAQKQQYDHAMTAFLKAMPPAKAKCNLAFVLTTQGKRDEARESYREALRLDPGLDLAKQALAKLESPGAIARKEPAKESVRPASRVTPSTPSTPLIGGHVIDRDSPIIIGPEDGVPVQQRK